MKNIFLILLFLALSLSQASAVPFRMLPQNRASGLVPSSVTITSGILTSPIIGGTTSQVNGWTADVLFTDLTPTGLTTAYAFNPASNSIPNYMCFTATDGGYDTSANYSSSANARTICATSWLRQPTNAPVLANYVTTGGTLPASTSLEVTRNATDSTIYDVSPGATTGTTSSATITLPAGTCYNIYTTSSGSPSKYAHITSPSGDANCIAGGTTYTVDATGTAHVPRYIGQGYYPVEVPAGGNATLALTLSDYVYQSSSVGTATFAAGLYTDAASNQSPAKSGVTVTNNSTVPYQKPTCSWVTEPGLRSDGSADFKVEVFCGSNAPANNAPVAAVQIIASDTGAHTVTKLATLGQSTRLFNTTGTATTGSSTITGISDTSKFIVGSRITVIGIPGQPKILSKTSTSITLGVTTTCTTTATNGNVTMTTAPASGEAFDDGGFVGATISSANLTGGVGTITSVGVPTFTSSVPTGVTVVVNSNGTSASAAACTINHIYQGTTGTVAITMGTPVPVYSATFTSSDFSGWTDGVLTLRAKAYPWLGDSTAVLDTQTGSDGTGNDWDGSAFNVNGTDHSWNLHNLFAYLDAGGSWAPKYAFVGSSGTCTIQTTNVDPGSGAYCVDIKAATSALQTYYNTNGSISTHHNTADGGVIVLTTTGTPYSGFGTASLTALYGTTGTRTLTIMANGSDQTAVTLQTGTNKNTSVGGYTVFRNITMSGNGVVVQGADLGITTGFPQYEAIFDNVIIRMTAQFVFPFRTGVTRYYNSLTDSSAGAGSLFAPSSTLSNAPAFIGGNSLICGTYTANKDSVNSFTILGNIGFACSAVSISGPRLSNTYPQPLAINIYGNKFMASLIQTGLNATAIQNVFYAQNIVEATNRVGGNPAFGLVNDSSTFAGKNVTEIGNTIIGSRENTHYEEGVCTAGGGITVSGSGGAFTAGVYYVMITHMVTSGGAEDYFINQCVTPSVAANGTINVIVPYDYTGGFFNIYIGTSWGNMANVGLTGSGDAINIANAGNGSNTIVLTNVGSARTPPSNLTSPNPNYIEYPWKEFWTLNNSYNCKNDAYGNASGAIANPARLGNWAARWKVGDYGLVTATGTAIGNGYNPNSGLGEVLGAGSYVGTVLSSVPYKSDRSYGNEAGANLTTAGGNLGNGDYRLDLSGTNNALNRIKAGFNAFPFDINGNTRLNDGTGAAGAFEQGGN